jgi:hypothetical protein
VSDRELAVKMDGPVTALLARAAELGATEIATERRDLDEIFVEMYHTANGETS